MKRKILMLALLTAVFALLLCVGAGAVDEYDLWVNGVHVTSDNAADVLGNADEGATVKYDAATNTLTLDGAELSVLHTYDNQYYGVILARTDDPLTVNVIGDSKITVGDPGENAGSIRCVCGILHDETGFAPVNKTWSINLTGTATLDIEVNYFGSGIRAHEDVDIEKLTLNINVNKTDDITDEYGGGNAYLYDTLQDAVNDAAKRTDTESVTIHLLKQPESTEVKLPSETPDNITLSKLGTEDINFSEVNITDAAGSKVTVGNDGIYEHAIIITGYSNGEYTWCAHTNDRLDEGLSFLEGYNCYRVMRF